MSRYIDLTGKKFERLTVEKLISTSPYTKWSCVCDCGENVIVYANHLKNGSTRSCGCLRSILLKERLTKHGLSGHLLYGVWHGMHRRCENESHVAYNGYGGSGVTVAPEWDDYETFYNWAIANGWEKGLQIDKDILGDGLIYSPKTCMFVIPKLNSRHKKVTKLTEESVKYIRDSKEKTSVLMEKFNVSNSTISRVKNYKRWI